MGPHARLAAGGCIMRSRFLAYCSLTALFALSACANANSVFRTKPLGTASTAHYIDIKQRAIFSKTYDGKEIVCAEPSPDALATYAAALQGKVSEPSGVSVGVGGSVSETAASVGLRTQTIQLLRDSMYRYCEGVMNRRIDDDQFAVLHRRFQSTMVAMLAIEQLTGAVAAKQALLTSRSQSGVSGDLIDLASAKNAAARKKEVTAAAVDEQKRLVKEAEVALAADASNADLKKSHDDAVTELAMREASKKAAATAYIEAETLFAAAMQTSTSTSGSGEFAAVPTTPMTAEAVQNLGNAIVSIVGFTNLSTFANDQCQAVLMNPEEKKSKDSLYQEYRKFCMIMLKESTPELLRLQKSFLSSR